MTFHMHNRLWFVHGHYCGLFCASFTWFVVLFVDWAVVLHVVVPWLGASFSWSLVLSLLQYQSTIFLILASHLRCVFTDPGVEPYNSADKSEWEDILVQFEEDVKFEDEMEQRLRLRQLKRQQRFCAKCELFKRGSAHHCSTCQRCIRDMDHHCPWINNCVGENNIKYFLQFLFFVGLGSLHAMLLMLTRVFVFIKQDPPRRTGSDPIRDFSPQIFSLVVAILAFMMSLFFLIFIIGMSWDQYEALTTGTTGIDALQGKVSDADRPLLHGLVDACGEQVSWRWVFPVAPPPRRRVHED